MSKTKISEYSSTAADNTDIGGINIGEGMAPSDVNNAMREQMSQLKEFLDGSSGDTLTTSNLVATTGSFSGTVTFNSSAILSSGDEVGFRNIPQSGAAKTTGYTLATGDVGKLIEVGSGGSITVPDATFAAGDAVLIFNNTTGDITITCSITTAYIGGANVDEASVTLATRGVANVLFISGTVCVITGNVT